MLYKESLDIANDHQEQTFHEEPLTEGEEEHLPLPILGPSLTQESELSSNKHLL